MMVYKAWCWSFCQP